MNDGKNYLFLNEIANLEVLNGKQVEVLMKGSEN